MTVIYAPSTLFERRAVIQALTELTIKHCREVFVLEWLNETICRGGARSVSDKEFYGVSDSVRTCYPWFGCQARMARVSGRYTLR
jgi:hypothetical protein